VGTTILSTIGALFVGGAVASATVFGLVSSQTSAPSKSPVSVTSPEIEYGSNG
jgi:hypothetical protein